MPVGAGLAGAVPGQGVLKKTVAEMRGVTSGELMAWLVPIGPDAFEVGAKCAKPSARTMPKPISISNSR